jgi:DNA-binding response OmpR family regulator
MPARILVVDDDLDTLKLLHLILENAGFQPILAEGGSQAVAIIRDQPPALILCDVLMPGVDGFAVLLAVRSDPATARIPVVMLSALGQEQDVKRAMEAGASGYVIKPFSLRPLLAEVNRHLPQPAG